MTTINYEVTVAMTTNEEVFCRALGKRISDLRKDHGMTQKDLADTLGVKQYTIANYETGRYRVPVAVLPELARSLGVTVEVLLGLPATRSKRGPASKLQKQMERISALPKEQQKSIMQVLDMALKTRA